MKVAGVRRRARLASRRLAGRTRPVAVAAATRVSEGARSLPLPAGVRVRMSKALLRRPHPIRVPMDKLLLGSQAGLPAGKVAELLDDPLWPSTPVAEGPHVALLRLGSQNGHVLTSEEILATACRVTGAKPGKVSTDGRFSITRVECQGACTAAPMLVLDGAFHENLTAESTAKLLGGVR